MNKQRETRIAKAITTLDDLKAKVESVKDELDDVLMEEDDARGNIPESFESSEKYIKSEDASESLGYAIDSLSDAVENIADAIGEITQVV